MNADAYLYRGLDRTRTGNPAGGEADIAQTERLDRTLVRFCSARALRRSSHGAQYERGSPSTCSARYERIKFVEIGAT